MSPNLVAAAFLLSLVGWIMAAVFWSLARRWQKIATDTLKTNHDYEKLVADMLEFNGRIVQTNQDAVQLLEKLVPDQPIVH